MLRTLSLGSDLTVTQFTFVSVSEPWAFVAAAGSPRFVPPGPAMLPVQVRPPSKETQESAPKSRVTGQSVELFELMSTSGSRGLTNTEFSDCVVAAEAVTGMSGESANAVRGDSMRVER